MGRHGDYIKIR